jgi:hypothetical protein
MAQAPPDDKRAIAEGYRHPELPEPQGEPPEAEIDAAARAMFAITNQLSMSGARDLARADLLAAGGVR